MRVAGRAARRRAPTQTLGPDASQRPTGSSDTCRRRRSTARTRSRTATMRSSPVAQLDLAARDPAREQGEVLEGVVEAGRRWRPAPSPRSRPARRWRRRGSCRGPCGPGPGAAPAVLAEPLPHLGRIESRSPTTAAGPDAEARQVVGAAVGGQQEARVPGRAPPAPAATSTARWRRSPRAPEHPTLSPALPPGGEGRGRGESRRRTEKDRGAQGAIARIPTACTVPGWVGLSPLPSILSPASISRCPRRDGRRGSGPGRCGCRAAPSG